MEETREEKFVNALALACFYVNELGLNRDDLMDIGRLFQLESVGESLDLAEEEWASITRELFQKYASEVLAEARDRKC